MPTPFIYHLKQRYLKISRKYKIMVELLNYFGGDTNHANVAWVSYAKEAKNYTEEQNAKLIKYLVAHQHTSVFRHSTLQFRIKCPIYVERQLFKHSVGISVNSISGRYVDFSDSYATIKEWRKQSKSSKQGSEGLIDNQEKAKQIENSVILFCQEHYKNLLALGVSKEQARSVLPLSLETEFIWTGSFLAFMHMCNLRLKEDTQAETRAIVQQMLDLVKNIEGNPFEHTLKVWEKNK
jgi:thymidylate synthase (FAD)